MMESSSQQSTDKNCQIPPCAHHKQLEFCMTRAPYRQGKEFKAVKVYTINDESQHLLIQNVPSIGLLEEIKRLTGKFGRTEIVELVNDYPVEEFTHVYHVKYKYLRDARQAKKRLDNRSFYGNLLHICYAPELESVEECRWKLHDRIKSVQRSSKAHLFSQKIKSVTRNSKTEDKIDEPIPTCSSSVGTWHDLLPATATTIISRNVKSKK